MKKLAVISFLLVALNCFGQQSPQEIKAILSDLKTLQETHDDFYDSAHTIIQYQIQQIESAPTLTITDPRQITLAIWHSSMADLLMAFYENHQYEILNRTNVSGEKNADFKTWDIQTLVQEIIYHYNQSLVAEDLLQQTPVTNYLTLMTDSTSGIDYRPTMYDFLTHKALSFFMEKLYGLSLPINPFTLNDSLYFSDNKTFSKLSITTTDENSTEYLSLRIFQKLTLFHLQSGNSKALIDLSLERINYLYNNYSLKNKESLYLSFLNALEETYRNAPGHEDICFALGNYYNELGNRYTSQPSEKSRTALTEAVRWYQKAITTAPESIAAYNAKIKILYIQKESIELSLNFELIPNQENLISCHYKNVHYITFRIIPITKKEVEKLNLYYLDQEMKKILNYKELHAWTLKTPYNEDYQSKIADINIPTLAPGNYLLVAIPDNQKGDSISGFTYTQINVTNIGSCISRLPNSMEFLIYDRTTGDPIRNQSVTAFYTDYNRNHYHQKIYKTNKNGIIEVPFHKKYNQIGIDITKGKDKYESIEYYYIQNKPDSVVSVKFFTDRAIYRPGQTIYFKGIVIQSSYKKNVLKTNMPVKVALKDNNWQTVREMEFTTNEFGSFSGSYTIPNDGITGKFSLNCLNQSHSVSVEEYKRPQFEVILNPPQEDYKINEWITISGNAKAYAGYPIDGATVTYRVKRTASFPYRYKWNSFYPSTQEQEIAQGTLTTNQNGEFTITFQAIAEPNDQEFDPIYNFQIIADVTDINGETHSANTHIPVSKKSLILELDMPEVILSDQNESQFSLSALNLQREIQEATVQCRIFQLEMPPFYKHPRHYQIPNSTLVDSQLLARLFPYIDLNQENNPEKWKIIAEKPTFDIQTGENNSFKIPDFSNYQEGAYKMIATTQDKYGQPVATTSFFFIQKTDHKKCTIYKPLWVAADRETVNPGQTLTIHLGTYLPEAHIWVEIISNDSLVHREWISLKKGITQYQLPIQEKHYGSLTISTFLFNNGYYYQENMTIKVPFTHKKLKMELATFKNILEPGAKEEWMLKVKGKDGEQLAAEILCNMYDASLDAFLNHRFDFTMNYLNLKNHRSPFRFSDNNYGYINSFYHILRPAPCCLKHQSYYSWRFPFVPSYYYSRGIGGGARNYSFTVAEEAPVVLFAEDIASTGTKAKGNAIIEQSETIDYDYVSGEDALLTTETPSAPLPRSNFSETAFFLPQLKTDAEGNVIFSFTMPESITKWKFQSVAHTKDLKTGTLEQFVQTQKELMIVPNLPRFLREDDYILFSAKVVNMQDHDLAGSVSLTLTDAMTDTKLNIIGNDNPQPFVSAQGESAEVFFKVAVPRGMTAIRVSMIATSNEDLNTGMVYSDGIETVLPVLSNRIRVIESLPLFVNSQQTKTFVFDKLKTKANSASKEDLGILTFEFTPNPIWYAVQALPYMMEFPHECNEQLFNRMYANAIATYIANSSPKIKAVFDAWKNKTPDAFYSNLQKNEELKNIVLEETPWVLDAQNEQASKQRIGLLFDIQNMAAQKETAFKKLEKNQNNNGSWGWFSNGYENRYITQYIISGFGHLNTMGVIKKENSSLSQMIRKATQYMDQKINEDYLELKKNPKINIQEYPIGYHQIQYLYARSYFLKDYDISKKDRDAYLFYLNQAKKQWKENKSVYMQAMIALALYRNNEIATATQIMEYLKNRAQHSEEMGMYWKKEGLGFYWYESAIERQSLLIEAFLTILKDENSADQMKQWLLKQKQTQNWGSTRSTAEACYALLIDPNKSGKTLITEPSAITVTMGSEKFQFGASPAAPVYRGVTPEPGTGYVKTSWKNEEITPDKATVVINQPGKGIAWGALYWQYFEESENITESAQNPLSLKKMLYKVGLTDKGETLIPITEEQPLKVGDKVRVRIELRCDRDMEFVHLKDMRAAGFEPTNVLSGYKYQDGLYYYESTRDAATNFFFDYISKGTYVFEYTLIATLAGNYHNGISSVQCMYAPEFTSHSAGTLVRITK